MLYKWALASKLRVNKSGQVQSAATAFGATNTNWLKVKTFHLYSNRDINIIVIIYLCVFAFINHGGAD